MKIYAGRNDKGNELDKFVGKDLWVKTHSQLEVDLFVSAIKYYTRIRRIDIIDGQECYVVNQIDADYVDKAHIYESSSTLAQWKEVLEKEHIRPTSSRYADAPAIVNPITVLTTDEILDALMSMKSSEYENDD